MVLGNSFKKESRLLTKSDFLFLQKRGSLNRLSEGVLNAVFILGSKENGDKTRIGIAIPKKVGNSVVRNKVKRLIRESFRLNDLKLNKNIDIVFTLKKSNDPVTLSGLKLKNFQDSLQKIFRQIISKSLEE